MFGFKRTFCSGFRTKFDHCDTGTLDLRGKTKPRRVAGLSPTCEYAVEYARHILSIHSRSDKQFVKSLMNDFLHYLLETFRFEGDLDSLRINEIFSKLHAGHSYLAKGELEKLSENLIPLAVVRELVYHRRVPLDPKRASWRKFSERYGRILMAS